MEEKPWGHEVCWNALPSIHGKVLYIKKGHRTSFKYHERKDEVLFVLEGKLKVTYADEEWLHYTNTNVRHDVLSAGESFTAQASCPYRIEALDDSKDLQIYDDALKRLGDKVIELESMAGFLAVGRTLSESCFGVRKFRQAQEVAHVAR